MGKRQITNLRQKLNLDRRTARLGDGSGETHDRRRPGNYFVRFTRANGTYTAPISLPAAPNANLPTDDGTPVEVGFDLSGRQVILQVNVNALAQGGTNNLQLNPLDQQASRFINQTQISTFYATRHADVTNKPFYAVVFPGFIYPDAGILYFPGGEIDLSGFVPSADEHCFAVLFIKEDATLEAFASTAINESDPLTTVDIQEAIDAMTAGSMPLWAVEIRGEDTELTVAPERWVDIRAFVGDGGGGGASSITFTAAPTGVFDVTGSPGDTIALSMDSQTGRVFLASPSGGGAGVPGFRVIEAADIPDISATYVPKSLYDANTILKADSDNTPIALTMGASTILARLASGSIVAATVAQIKTLLAYVFTDIPGSLGLAKGGTNADLSATGPGALVQATLGANVTVETLAATRGGTGQTTITTGDTLYGSASNVISKLAAGTNGFFYKMVAGIPAWAAIAASDIASGILALARGGTGADLSATGGTGQVLKQSSAGAAVTVAALVAGDIPNLSATYIATAIITAKGDLIAGTVSLAPSIRTVGTNGQVLSADSTDPTGLKWTTTPTSVLFQHFADAGNTTTSETDLYSDTTPASTFSNNGDVLNALYSGVFVSSATATRQLKAYFGGTAIYDSGALSISVADSWQLTISIIRESSTVVRCIVDLKVGGVSVTASPTYTRITGLTLSGTNILKITGTAAGVGAATNDIVAKSGVVSLPASASALGANTALSNLASVAVNTTLASDTDNTDDLGTATIKWGGVFAYRHTLDENTAPSAPAAGDLLQYAGTAHNFRQLTSAGQDDIQHHGDYAGYLLFTNTSSLQTLYSRTIKGNSLGANGAIRVTGKILLRATSNNNRNILLLFDFGGTTLFTWTTSGTTATSGREVLISFDLTLTNANATNAQISAISGMEHSGALASFDPTVATITPFTRANTGHTEDTTADQVFTIFATPNAANNTLERLFVKLDHVYGA